MKTIIGVTPILSICTLFINSCVHTSRTKPAAIPSQPLERSPLDQFEKPLTLGEENFGSPAENELPASGKSRDDLIPMSWNVLSEDTGDLNKDMIEDLLLVVEGTDSRLIDTTKRSEEDGYRPVDKNPRILAIYVIT